MRYNKDVLNKRNEAASFVEYLLYPPQKTHLRRKRPVKPLDRPFRCPFLRVGALLSVLKHPLAADAPQRRLHRPNRPRAADGGKLLQLKKVALLAVAVNPFSAFGYEYDAATFEKKMRDAVNVPVFNVKNIKVTK